jgi:hypothetical protein
MEAWLQELLDVLFKRMTPEQKQEFERAIRNEIGRLDEWKKQSNARRGTKRKAAKNSPPTPRRDRSRKSRP